MWEETRARRVKQSQQTRRQSRKRRQIRLVSHKEIEVNLPKEGKEIGILKREGGERGGGEDQDIFKMDKRAEHIDNKEVRIGEGKETMEEVMEGNLTAGMVIGSQGGEDGIEGKGGGGVMTEATTTILTTGIGILDRDGEREMDGVQDQAGVKIGTRNTDLLLRQVSGEAENSRMTGICHCMGGRAEDCNAGENLFTFVEKMPFLPSLSRSLPQRDLVEHSTPRSDFYSLRGPHSPHRPYSTLPFFPPDSYLDHHPQRPVDLHYPPNYHPAFDPPPYQPNPQYHPNPYFQNIPFPLSLPPPSPQSFRPTSALSDYSHPELYTNNKVGRRRRIWDLELEELERELLLLQSPDLPNFSSHLQPGPLKPCLKQGASLNIGNAGRWSQNHISYFKVTF